MTGQHSSYEELAGQRRDSDQQREGYAEARRAFLIGQAVRERRLALGLSQVQLAARADMTQSALSRLEAGEGGLDAVSASWTIESEESGTRLP